MKSLMMNYLLLALIALLVVVAGNFHSFTETAKATTDLDSKIHKNHGDEKQQRQTVGTSDMPLSSAVAAALHQHRVRRRRRLGARIPTVFVSGGSITSSISRYDGGGMVH